MHFSIQSTLAYAYIIRNVTINVISVDDDNNHDNGKSFFLSIDDLARKKKIECDKVSGQSTHFDHMYNSEVCKIIQNIQNDLMYMFIYVCICVSNKIYYYMYMQTQFLTQLQFLCLT